MGTFKGTFPYRGCQLKISDLVRGISPQAALKHISASIKQSAGRNGFKSQMRGVSNFQNDVTFINRKASKRDTLHSVIA